MIQQRSRSRRLDRVKAVRLRTAIQYLLERDQLYPGSQAALGAYYGITRQRVQQIVNELRQTLTKRD